MTNKTIMSEEVKNYFELRDKALEEIANRISANEAENDRVLKLDGLGYNFDQEEHSARITLGVSNIAAFTEELIALDEPWTSHVSKLPDDLREQVLRDDGDVSLSGGMHRHDRYIMTENATGKEFPIWLSQVIYQNDDPILEAFYIGHEEGHILHKTDNLGVLYSLWTEHIDELVNSGCLNLNEDALIMLLNNADEMKSMDKNPAITEAVAHLSGLFASFERFDPQEAVPRISPGTDTEEFRHVIWLLGYRGDYCIGCEDTRRVREAVYNWGDTGRQLQQPNFDKATE